MALDGFLLPVAIGRDALAFAARSQSSSGAARARRLLGVIRGASGRALLIAILPVATIPLGAQSASIQNRGAGAFDARTTGLPAPLLLASLAGVTRGHLAGDLRIASGTPDTHRAGRVSKGALQQGPERQWQARPTVDRERLHGGAIALTELPPAAGLTSRAPSGRDASSIWRSGFIGTALLIMLQTVLIVILLVQRVRRQTIERFRSTNEVALRSSLARVRQLAGLMINVQEADRSRIARDLHDDACQQLASLALSVSEVARQRGDVQGARSQEALADIKRRVVGLIEAVRRVSYDLHPTTLCRVGLVGALESHCIEFERRHDAQVSVTTKGSLQHTSEDVALCVFRVCQEALRNAVTHGNARRIDISVARSRHELTLTIVDDGTGFDLTAAHSGRGLGLVSMEERAHLTGGGLEIVTAVGSGTTIRARIPVAAITEAEAVEPAPMWAPDWSVPDPEAEHASAHQPAAMPADKHRRSSEGLMHHLLNVRFHSAKARKPVEQATAARRETTGKVLVEPRWTRRASPPDRRRVPR